MCHHVDPITSILVLGVHVLSCARIGWLCGKMGRDTRSQKIIGAAVFLLALIGPIPLGASIGGGAIGFTMLIAMASFLSRKRFWVSCAMVAAFSVTIGFIMGAACLHDELHQSDRATR